MLDKGQAKKKISKKKKDQGLNQKGYSHLVLQKPK